MTMCSRRCGVGKGSRLFYVSHMTGYDALLLLLLFSSILPLIMMCYGFMTILFCVYDMTIQDEMMFSKILILISY